MTLAIIFGCIIIFFIIIAIVSAKHYDEEICAISIVIAIVFVIVFAINLIPWLVSKGNSEIKFEQLNQERTTINAMLDTNNDMDRYLLNEEVLDYNNRVIKAKRNCSRIIYRDYYSDDVDWEALQLIEWR